jgi:hypothetical protein
MVYIARAISSHWDDRTDMNVGSRRAAVAVNTRSTTRSVACAAPSMTSVKIREAPHRSWPRALTVCAFRNVDGECSKLCIRLEFGSATCRFGARTKERKRVGLVFEQH